MRSTFSYVLKCDACDEYVVKLLQSFLLFTSSTLTSIKSSLLSYSLTIIFLLLEVSVIDMNTRPVARRCASSGKCAPRKSRNLDMRQIEGFNKPPLCLWTACAVSKHQSTHSCRESFLIFVFLKVSTVYNKYVLASV